MLEQLINRYLNTSLSRKIIILITLFVTFVPTTLIATLSYAYYKVGIESLFNEQMSKAINQTVEIASRYVTEHKDNVRADVLAVANDIERNFFVLNEDPSLYVPFLDKQAELRNLAEVVIFQRDRMIARNSFAFSFAFEKLPEAELADADRGEVVFLSSMSEDKVRAVIKLRNYAQTYLLVSTYVDKSIIDYLRSTQGTAIKFSHLMTDLKATQLRIELLFLFTFLVLSAISFILGRKLAHVITMPLNELVAATQKLKAGDFNHKLPHIDGGDETAVLTRAFNDMTDTLSKQRKQLIKINQILENRRSFIEKVLSEISAGVVSTNADAQVLIANAKCCEFLGIKKASKNDTLTKIFPEILPYVELARQNPSEILQKSIKITRLDKTLHMLTRIGFVLEDDKIETIIITFDDITELVSAQRSAAWGDVARRVAHEIKNPLTPIMLAAERLKTKYSDQITEGNATYIKYIDTITKHVGDIGHIIEEFVEFARIPSPKMKKADLARIVRDQIFSQKLLGNKIDYSFDVPEKSKFYARCDSMLISQVLLNILKNSAESILQKADKMKKFKGHISVELDTSDEKFITVVVRDNGVGIDKESIDKIFEPYVTSKSKGTGLGLAIVKKIIEEHSGNIAIRSLPEGAEVRFSLQKHLEENDEKAT